MRSSNSVLPAAANRLSSKRGVEVIGNRVFRRLVMKISVDAASSASSTAYWIRGLSTMAAFPSGWTWSPAGTGAETATGNGFS
jgi:hypothetical protein